MDKGERTYNTLKYLVMALGLSWFAWAAYDGLVRDKNATVLGLEAAHKMFSDGDYEKALAEFGEVLDHDPGNAHALRGVARSLMQLGRAAEALEAYDRALVLEPDFAAAHANRAILLDRMGHYRAAISGYEQALQLDRELDRGPSWLTRFLRNQQQMQSTLGARAQYLREQLLLAPEDRLLRVNHLDEQQRAYDQ